MNVQPHDSLAQLQRLRHLKSHRPIALRLQMVILALAGHTAPQIAHALGHSRRRVQAWVYRYNDQGVAGLWDQPRSGQPPKLPRDKQAAFKQRLQAGPTAADAGVCTLRGADAQRILRQEFGADYSLGGAIKLLHRLGFSCLQPRPQHRKQDPLAAAHWVAQAPLLSKLCVLNTPSVRSRSGSRMRLVLDNKAP